MSRSENSESNLVEDLLWVVPRLWDRTARQVELTRSLAGHIPCLGSLVAGSPRHSTAMESDANDTGVLNVLAEEQPDLDLTGAAATQSPSGGLNGAGASGAPLANSVPEIRRPEDSGLAGDPRASRARASTTSRAPSESDLAIPQYDSLAASQVIPRLEMLESKDLGLILDYEEHHRNRQTIVHKVRQLLSVGSN